MPCVSTSRVCKALALFLRRQERMQRSKTGCVTSETGLRITTSVRGSASGADSLQECGRLALEGADPQEPADDGLEAWAKKGLRSAILVDA